MRHKRLFASMAAAAALVIGVFVAAPEAAQATALVKCDVNANGTEDNDKDVAIRSERWDPIVFHNVDPTDSSQPQPHLHDFFGNRLAAATDNFNDKVYSDLRSFSGGAGAGATSCRIAEDTASYWAPAMVYTSGPKAGERVGVRQFSAYYRGFAGQVKHPGSQAIPAGARLVAQQGPGYGLTGWTCGANSTVTGGQDTIPDCSASGGGAGDSLTAHINFPSCWNGVAPNHPGDPGNTNPDTEQGDTRDNADFIYPTSKTACPASHPIEIIQLRETIAYDYTGDGTDVALTSDLGVPRGSSMHVDFWNTWDQAALVSLAERCIQTAEEPSCKP